MAFCVAVIGVLLHAQTRVKPEFEVASVKPAVPPPIDMQHGPIYGGPGTSSPGEVTYTNLTLKLLIEWAYSVNRYQLSVPAWTDEGHFDIVAKVPVGASKADMLPMLQSLLEERFQLKTHHELRETQAYALTVGKTGSKMKEYPMQLPEGFIEGRPRFTGIDKDGFFITPPGYAIATMGSRNGLTRVLCVRLPLTLLRDTLSGILQRPIVDQTHLMGRYDFHLMFATEGPAALTSADDRDLTTTEPQASDPAPTIMNAVQDQLGLKLEQKKLPVDFLVVDHAEKKPTEN